MKNRPDILWLVIDCARYDRLSAHGYHRQTSPTLDRLISEGIDYQYAYSAATWSLPSYTSLLTGLYPRIHGVQTIKHRLDQNIDTLALAMRQAGYRTACFSANAWLAPNFGIDRGFDHFELAWWRAQKLIKDRASYAGDYLLGKVKRDEDKGARRLARRLVKWQEALNDVPTFTFVAFVEPHAPYSQHRKLSGIFGDNARIRQDVPFKYDQIFWVEEMPDPQPLPQESIDAIQLSYDIELRYVDNVIGNLLTELEKRGALDNVIVIVTADHGDMLGEQNKYGHQLSITEPLRHVPLILWAPSIFAGPRSIDHLVQTVDIPGSLCDWLDVPWERTPLTFNLPIQDKDPSRDSCITDYSISNIDYVKKKYPDLDTSSFDKGLICASDKRYKVVLENFDTWHGYDLVVDPLEENSLAIRNHPEFEFLKEQIDGYLSLASNSKTSQSDLPEAIETHLKALGYLE